MNRNAADWPRVKGILGDAIALPADARAAFLDTACATDDNLRRQVEQLLAAHDQADAFLETPPEVPARFPIARWKGSASAPMNSSHESAPAAWATCTRRATSD